MLFWVNGNYAQNSNLGQWQYLNMACPYGTVQGNRAYKSGNCIHIVAEVHTTSTVPPNGVFLTGKFNPLIGYVACGGMLSFGSGLHTECYVTEGAINIDNSASLPAGSYGLSATYII